MLACRDEHASDLQILTRLSLGQVMSYVLCANMWCYQDKKLHREIRPCPAHVDINAGNCTGWGGPEHGRSSHVKLRHICGHFTGSYTLDTDGRPGPGHCLDRLMSKSWHTDNCPVATLIRIVRVVWQEKTKQWHNRLNGRRFREKPGSDTCTIRSDWIALKTNYFHSGKRS